LEPLHSTAPSALRALLVGQPTTPAKVAFAWKMAAGPALARASTPVWSAEGTLYVRASTDAWRQELRRAKPILLDRLGGLLGKDVVRRIEVS